MTNFYEVLGVAFDADESEIKRAWARLVRVHTPDVDPDGNRRIGEAKATLLDPRARSDYDAQLLYGEDLQKLFEDAHDSMDAEDYDEAIKTYKEILALHPSSLDARNQMGLACAYSDKFEESVKHLQVLTKAAPDSALYAANLGGAYRRWSATDESKWEEAVRWYTRATELESYNSGHFVTLSELYIDREMYAEAEQALESAIAADGKTDVDDLDSLIALTWVYLFAKQESRIEDLAGRVRAALPDEKEAREYAVFRFLRVAAELAFDYQKFTPASLFVAAARKIDSDLGEFTEGAEEIEKLAKVDTELEVMFEDESIHPPIFTRLLAFSAGRRMGYEFSDEVIDKLIDVASTWSQSELRAASLACEKKYPLTCDYVRDLLPALVELGDNEAPSKPARSGSGCMSFIVIAVIFAIIRQVVNANSTEQTPVQTSYEAASISAPSVPVAQSSDSLPGDNLPLLSDSDDPPAPAGWQREVAGTRSAIAPIGWKREVTEKDGLTATKWTNPKDGAVLTYFESAHDGSPVNQGYLDESARMQEDKQYEYEFLRLREGEEAFHNGVIWNFKLSKDHEPMRNRMIAFFILGDRYHAISLSYLSDLPNRPYASFFNPVFDEVTSWH